MATDGLFSGAFLLPSTGRCPAEVLLVTRPATVFLEPFVLKPCQFSAGSALLCKAATALLLGLLCLPAHTMVRHQRRAYTNHLRHYQICNIQYKQW